MRVYYLGLSLAQKLMLTFNGNIRFEVPGIEKLVKYVCVCMYEVVVL